MKKKKVLKKISVSRVRIFKIANRRGCAAICLNNLTEGRTAYQAYWRMIKALKRNGFELPSINMNRAKRLIVKRI